MQADTDIMTWGQRAIDTLNRWPSWLLLACGCLILGYVLRNWKRCPNEAIPGFIVMFGALMNAILAGGDPHESGWYVWTARNVLIGAIIGWCIWRLHHTVLKPLENKFPWLKFLIPSEDDSTKSFTRGNVPKPPVNGPTIGK